MERARPFPQQVFVIIVLLWPTLIRCQGPENDCYFSPVEVNEGNNSTLTCRFNMDVKEHTKNFYVQRSNDTVFEVNEHVVVDCAWPKDSSGLSPHCTSSAGYLEPIIDGRTVTIDILNAKQGQAGYYKCFVVNPDPPSTPNICSFSVVLNEGPVTTQSPAVSNRSDSEPISKGIIIGLATGGCVVVLAAIGAALLIYCRCRQKRGKFKRSTAQPGSREQRKDEIGMLQTGIVRDGIKKCENRDRHAKDSSQQRRKLHNDAEKRRTIL